MMSRRTRVILIVVGMVLLAVGLAALAFAWMPVQVFSDQAPVAPTLFVLPGNLP